MSSGLYSHTTRAVGTILTASIYNTDHVNHVTNQNPSQTGAYSDTVAQMQATTDPGGVGTESLAASLAGEIERIRFVLAKLGGWSKWYAYSEPRAVPNVNFSFNGDFRIWGAGASAVPTAWSLSGAGASAAKDSVNFKVGSASAALTRAGGDTYIFQRPNTFLGFGPVAWWQGKEVTFGCWVRATVAARARLALDDGVGTSYSSYHSGNSAFAFLTVTRTIDAAATRVELRCQVDTGDTTAQFSGAILVKGNVVSDFIPSGWGSRKCVLSFHMQGGGATLGAGTTGYFSSAGGDSAGESNQTTVVPYNCVVRNLQAQQSAAPGGGQTTVYVFRLVGGDTTLAATVAGAAFTAGDTTHEVAVTAAQQISMRITQSGGAAATIPGCTVECEEVP